MDNTTLDGRRQMRHDLAMKPNLAMTTEYIGVADKRADAPAKVFDLFVSHIPMNMIMDVVSEDPYLAYMYARAYIGSRVPKLEPIILSHGYYTYMYFVECYISTVVPQGEAPIDWIAEHGHPWQAGVDAMAKDPWAAYNYTVKYCKEPLPELVDVIATNTETALAYALTILKAPFEKGEAALAESPAGAYIYAVSALRQRFLAGEDVMRTNEIIWSTYSKTFGIEA